MSHSTTGRARAIALTVAALVSVPVLAGTAVAAPADMYAPYARAAAKVAANGEVLAQKNVSSVTYGTAAGSYCVKVSDPDIELKDAAVVATISNNRAMITAIGDPHPWCQSAANAITVVITDSAGAAMSAPFTVAVL
ncbi:hypothetical protein ACFYOG_34375 [Streptomyces sp. NPDC007818]|uniref:hypothetical protein n=1 Tax=Streptomyces sp. NPDC007818 TaxID=3364780 RepID=UPI003693E7D0